MSKQAREIFLYILAIVIVLCVVAFLILLASRETPPTNKDAIMLALGTLLTSFGTVVGYFFGSSKGSADKSEAMIEAAAHKPPTP